MDVQAPALLEDKEQRVFVGSLAGTLRSSHPELRLDSCNGLHKFFWISKGNGRCMINGVTRSFGPNTVIFIPNDVPHQLNLSNNVFGTVVTVDPAVNVSLPDKTVFLPILNLMDQKQIANRFDRVFSEFNTTGVGRNIAVEYLVGLLAVHLARMALKHFKSSKISASQRLMEGFVNLLERDFRSARTLSAYARELGVTPTHLTRVCQQVNGKSASRLIQERVLSEARMMLLNTDHKILEISNHLGFSSPAYFTRLFSAKLGKTPKEFRQAQSRFVSN
ncbi:MAG: helix-turn-helix domain-containing protein [Rhodobacteraceae bacterium]|nr:helix-turn-helix domain-containing protein [Paracoccaceae bacterium]